MSIPTQDPVSLLKGVRPVWENSTPVNVTLAIDVVMRLRKLLNEPEMRGIEFSDFINRACEAAETELVGVRRARSEVSWHDTLERLDHNLSDFE